MSRKALPWVIPEYCEGCTSCIAACKKKGCLSMFATAEEGIFIPWIENPDLCTGCGLCTQACVMGGISMTTYQDEAAQRFRSYIATNIVRKVYF